MATFFQRFVGALVLDASIYEDIEADRRANLQSMLVVLAVTAAGGIAGMGMELVRFRGFATGAVVALGGWLVWVSIITTLGTTTFAEPQTRANARELLRTLGYASAPGVFLAFAAMRSAAPLVFLIVSVWMIAAAVIAVRQALDYRSTNRALAVCVVAWLVSAAFIVLIGLFTSQRVS